MGIFPHRSDWSLKDEGSSWAPIRKGKQSLIRRLIRKFLGF